MLKVVRMRVADSALSTADAEARRLTGAQCTSGSGYFSTCYTGRGCAVKVVANVNKDGYLSYLKAVAPIMGTNPHVPNVWQVIVFDDGEEQAAIVQMEVLKHSARYYGDDGERDRAGDRFVPLLKRWHRGEDNPPTHHWAELMEVLYHLNNDWMCDLHSGNVMLRGTTWVLTDPLSFPFDQN